MSFKEALFGFVNHPIDEVGSNHKVAAVCLKIECWFTAVVLAIVAVFGTLFALAAFIGGPLVGAIIEEFGWDAGGEAGAAAGFVIGFIILFVVILTTALMGLFLWWTNTVYMKWNGTEEGAIIWVNIFAAILTFMSLPSFASFTNGPNAQFAGTGNIFGLVLGVLILIFANIANSKGELDDGHTVSEGAEMA